MASLRTLFEELIFSCARRWEPSLENKLNSMSATHVAVCVQYYK